MFNNKILFGYRLSNAGCCEDGVDNNGFSLVIYENEIAEYKTCIFNNIQNEYKEICLILKKYHNINLTLNHIKIEEENILY